MFPVFVAFYSQFQKPNNFDTPALPPGSQRPGGSCQKKKMNPLITLTTTYHCHGNHCHGNHCLFHALKSVLAVDIFWELNLGIGPRALVWKCLRMHMCYQWVALIRSYFSVPEFISKSLVITNYHSIFINCVCKELGSHFKCIIKDIPALQHYICISSMLYVK